MTCMRGRSLMVRSLGALALLIIAGCAGGGATASSPIPTSSQGLSASPSSSPQPSLTPTASPTNSPSPQETPRAFELGRPLAPGTYTAQEFITPLTFTVPAGWKVFEDEPGQFGLALVANDGPCICVWRDVRAASRTPVEEPQPDVGSSALEIATEIASRDGIEATEPDPVTIGGLNGYVMDLRLTPGTDGSPTLIGTEVSAGVWWGVGAGSEQRLYLLDIGENGAEGNVAVNGEVCCGMDFDEWTATLDRVIRSFEFSAAVGRSPQRVTS